MVRTICFYHAKLTFVVIRRSLVYFPGLLSRVPTGHPVRRYFEPLASYKQEKDVVGAGAGMHAQVIRWDKEIKVKRKDRIQ